MTTIRNLLKAGKLRPGDLATVQRRREWPARISQALQTFIQRQVVAATLDPSRPFRFPIILRLLLCLPILRNLPARPIAFGIWRVQIKQ